LKKRWAVLCLGLAIVARDGGAQTPSFMVIVNAQVPGKKVDRQILADIFLRKARRWGDGRPIDPVDLSATSPVREAFSRSVLGMPTDGVRQYWSRAIAEGVTPPLTKKSDEEVVEFVASHPGGVGYVAFGTPLLEAVRPVDVR
jgi:ABC-type phosphate transport system substrate-binding protein